MIVIHLTPMMMIKNCFDTCENNSFVSLNDNDGLESFTFGDESLSNEHVDDLHEMLCGDDEMNVDASLHELNDVEIVTFLDNCLDDALYIHELIGEDKEETSGDLRDVVSSKEEEWVEKENVKEEVEDKKKTSDESVREEDEEKVRNDEKEFGEKKKNEKRGKLEEYSILMDMDSCQPLEESMLCIKLKELPMPGI